MNMTMINSRGMGTSHLGNIDIETKHEIFRAIWGITRTDKDISSKYTEFFNFYQETCLFDFKESEESFLKERRYGDIISAITITQEGFDSHPKSEIRQELLGKLQLQSKPSVSEIDKMLEHSAKIWMFIDVKEWKSDETLENFIKRKFCSYTTDGLETRFPSSFNLRNLSHIAGIETQWTCDLSRHLLTYNDDSGVYMFHLASILGEVYDDSPRIPPILRTIAKETLETHSLLLPCHNASIEPWLKLQNKSRYRNEGRNVDIQVRSQRYLRSIERRLNRFPIWRERLLTLKDIYDEREPRGIVRFWRDDRRPIQWWTFWIAVLVFLLAVIQCIESAMQTYKAYHP